jgi:NH3-dependent NAD+ synthetase
MECLVGTAEIEEIVVGYVVVFDGSGCDWQILDSLGGTDCNTMVDFEQR